MGYYHSSNQVLFSSSLIYIINSYIFRYKLPGHQGTVNEVSFHPTEPIVASCSNDGKIYLGEIEKNIVDMS
jgi:WD40 repeat protein